MRQPAGVGQKTEPVDTASRRLLMIIAQKPTQSLAAPHWPLALPIRRPRKQQDVTLPLMIPLAMEMVDIVAQRPAFRFGLRAGSASGSTRPDLMMAQNDRVNLVSRSCRRYRQSRSAPQPSMVTFRAICFIHGSLG
jgi:hypothetical protein